MTRILIIRFSSIGDIVLTTPVVRCLKQQLPHCEIHFLTKPAYKSILETNPYIDKVHTLDGSLFKTALALKQYGFDYIIDLHGNLRTQVIKAVTGIASFTFNKLNAEKWLFVRTGIDFLPQVHIVDRYMNTLKTLGVFNDGKGLDYFIPEHTKLPEQLPTNYVALVIGAQHFTKRMPVDKLKKICSGLKQSIVVLGGKEDADIGEILSKESENIINYCGKLTLHESALVLKHAKTVISHDTGLMHIAAAFQKPIVSIWGNTVPAFGMYPYYGSNPVQQYMFEVSGLNCRPCSKIGFQECPKAHFKCMNDQPIDAIVASASTGL